MKRSMVGTLESTRDGGRVPVPTEWEEAYSDERSFRGSMLEAPLSALSLRAPVCVSPETQVGDAIRVMNEERIGAVLIVAPDGHLLGIFTERDVLKKVVGGSIEERDAVRQAMTPSPSCLRADDAVLFALKLMQEGGFRHVPLLDAEDRPVAVVSVKDVVEFLVGLFAKELATAPPDASHLTPRTSEGA